jgi:hypothetical protein
MTITSRHLINPGLWHHPCCPQEKRIDWRCARNRKVLWQIVICSLPDERSTSIVDFCSCLIRNDGKNKPFFPFFPTVLRFYFKVISTSSFIKHYSENVMLLSPPSSYLPVIWISIAVNSAFTCSGCNKAFTHTNFEFEFEFLAASTS